MLFLVLLVVVATTYVYPSAADEAVADPLLTPCTGHGQVVTISPQVCECYSGWYGDGCTDFNCSWPNGWWNYNDDKPLCNCNEGWTGQHCEVNTNIGNTSMPLDTWPGTGGVVPNNTSTTNIDNSSSNGNGTTNSINTSPDSPIPPSAAPSVSDVIPSSTSTSSTLYIGIAIGIAAMCGVMMILALMYRSRHRFHHLKQRLLSSHVNPTSSSIAMACQPPPIFTCVATPQLQPTHFHNAETCSQPSTSTPTP